MTAPSSLETLREFAPTISVGILTADLLRLGSEVSLIEQAGVKVVHFDVMDGCFCPMMTLGPPLIKAVKTPLLKDVHLMIEEPLDKVGDYVAAGADLITIHAESCRHPHRVLQQLGKMENANQAARGLIRGVALNPGTPLETIEPLLGELEMILLLAVNPGWGGQKFIESTHERLREVKKMVQKSGNDILIAVDGGIKRDNVAEMGASGVDLVVTGSAVFDGKAPSQNAKYMIAALHASPA
ncbi:MAG: ribulose-phosphate 3-epimerase [Acidobacteria bacterium]|nr:ribulose-phosphate 3-epimerase [Acidobacteriota bacterium]